MSRVTSLFTPLLITLLAIPTLAHAQDWVDGQPVFRDNSNRYQPYQGSGGYDQRWRHLDQRRYPKYLTGGPRPNISPQAPGKITFPNQEAVGTIIIDTDARKLYYTLSTSEAYEYPISVGREGFTWTGTEKISRIADWPSWHPPAEMRRRQPGLPIKMEGGLNNPLGAKSLYLGDTLYRIHGTNDKKTIGQAASSGCFRMMNKHVMHLASLAEIGATVKVVKSWPTSVARAGNSDQMAAGTTNQ